MDVLTQDVRKFLKEEMKLDTNQFMAAETTRVAARYELWREANGKPALRQDAKSVVSSWKEMIKEELRVKEGKQASSSGNSVALAGSSSGTRPSSLRVISLPTAASRKKQQQASSSPEPSMKKYAIYDLDGEEPTTPGNNTGTKQKKTNDYNGNSDTEGPLVLVKYPRANDVLSGRGGLTNQHAGNEWYRRLVRCSRGFYRNCPKHTKMLVAKAIVRAVHSQYPPGRFLELYSKENNVWREIDYKKAVDKSSQALRERWDQTDDDDILQRSMTIMFNKRLQVGSSGHVRGSSVEEAVYFAVMSVALEYARRWGTQGVASLTEQLRPIVKSAGNNAIPKPNGVIASRRATAPALSTAATPEGPTDVSNKKSPTSSANRPSGSAVQSPDVSPAPSSTQATPVIQKTAVASPVIQARSPVAQSSRVIPVQQTMHQTIQQSSPFRMINPNVPMVKNTVSPPINRPSSHSFGNAAPFATVLRHAPPQQRQPVPTPPPVRRISSGVSSGDKFGSPAPPELVATSSRMIDLSGEFTSVAERPSHRTSTVQTATAVAGSARKAPAGDTFGQPVIGSLSYSSSPSALNETDVVTASTVSPLSPDDNGFNTAKRKINNIATEEEIEAESEKRPKNHGMSPFHREILKMNLQLLVDW